MNLRAALTVYQVPCLRADHGCTLSLAKYAIHSPLVLLVCKLTIGLVSAYDIFLTIKYVESLPTLELNPIGRWLMQLDSGPECQLDQIACFITAKFSGNFITLALIEFLGSWRRSIATVVAISVATAQLILLGFLIHGSM
jgi:hypothetical protein